MENSSFFRRHWGIILVVSVVAFIGLYIVYTKSERYYFRNYNSLAYCKKYPEGKFKARALSSIIYSLDRDLNRWNDDFHFRLYFGGSEKNLWEFTQKYSTGEYRERLEELCGVYYHHLEEHYSGTVSPDVLDEFIDKVDDRYRDGIERRKSRVERLWGNESTAWGLVNEVIKDTFYLSDALDAIQIYLKRYPRGAHAIDAYELKDELCAELPKEDEDE